MGIEREMPVADIDDDVIPAELIEGLVGRDDLWHSLIQVRHRRRHRAVGHRQQLRVEGEVVLVALSVAGEGGGRTLGTDIGSTRTQSMA